MSASFIALSPHPVSPEQGVKTLSLQASRAGEALSVVFAVRGDMSRLVLPSVVGGKRTDGLWQRTCFEIFLRVAGQDAYVEYNFAPNGDWAAYHFDAYRSERRDVEMPPPKIESKICLDGIEVLVDIPTISPELDLQGLRLGPSAILADRDGERSYWALHHPLNKPDFHHIENFKISLD